MMQASTGQPEVDTLRIAYEDFLKLVPPLCPTLIFKVCAIVMNIVVNLSSLRTSMKRCPAAVSRLPPLGACFCF